MKAITPAHVEMNFIIAKCRVNKAQTKNRPSLADCAHRLGDEVLEHFEERRPWDGLFMEIHTEGSVLTVPNN